MRSCHAPVRRADSWMWPCSVTQRLACFDEPADGDAADVHVERHVVHLAAVERRPIEQRLVRRPVEQDDAARQVDRSDQRVEVLRNRPVPHCFCLNLHAVAAVLEIDASGIDVSRHIVAFPVLEPERRRRHARIPDHRHVAECDDSPMDVPPEPETLGLENAAPPRSGDRHCPESGTPAGRPRPCAPEDARTLAPAPARQSRPRDRADRTAGDLRRGTRPSAARRQRRRAVSRSDRHVRADRRRRTRA